jgi:hypothetical protein
MGFLMLFSSTPAHSVASEGAKRWQDQSLIIPAEPMPQIPAHAPLSEVRETLNFRLEGAYMSVARAQAASVRCGRVEEMNSLESDLVSVANEVLTNPENYQQKLAAEQGRQGKRKGSWPVGPQYACDERERLQSMSYALRDLLGVIEARQRYMELTQH